jgi:diguanylate cyclase (GGDEF)-like protein
MSTGATQILVRSLTTTALAVAASLALLAISRAMSGVAYTELDLIECIIFPILVSMPISWYIFSQAQKLREAHDQLVALNIETARAYDQLRKAHEVISFASCHDLMTRLLNREHFLQQLTAAYTPESDGVFLMIDADNFKQINDTFGHPSGDEALVLIANALKRSVPAADRVGRVGGEEFGVLLGGASVADAADLAERIRQDVASIDWRPDGAVPHQLSVSIGGAAFRDCPKGVSEVLLQADRCLYEAKRAGRNRIAFSYSISDVAYSMSRHRQMTAMAATPAK